MCIRDRSYAGNKTDRYEALKNFDSLLAIATFSRDPRGSRLLRFHAAEAVASGIPTEKVLAAVTRDAARILGVDDRVGTLEAGKHADLFIVGGDPLDPSAGVRLTMSNGHVVHENKNVQPVAALHAATEFSVPDVLPKNFALVSERVLFPDGQFAPAAVLVKEGKITGIRKGKGKKRTGDFIVIDVGQAVVTPGMLSAHVAGGSNQTTAAVSAHVRAVDSLSPGDTDLKKLSEGGFTSVVMAPGSRSVIAGQVGCVRIAAEDSILKNDAKPIACLLYTSPSPRDS